MSASGIYLVTLNNEHPISVNANDSRIAEKCIKVSRVNCKLGKAKKLTARERSYFKVFGVENVNFTCIAFTEDAVLAERLILKCLAQWRMRGPTGRKNEWLAGISAVEVERIALGALTQSAIVFTRPPKIE
jgi:hypothetical protein